MLNLETIGKRISMQRKLKGMTQNQLADTLYVTHQAVSKWENGKSVPSIELMYELTKLFDITIDYLIDDTEIKETDYESQFKNYPRDLVLNNFLANSNLDEDIPLIFYLLNQKERMKIINLVIAKQKCLSIKTIWPYLNQAERFYLLGAILSNKCDFDLNLIKAHLTSNEIMVVNNHVKDGTYNYQLQNIYHR